MSWLHRAVSARHKQVQSAGRNEPSVLINKILSGRSSGFPVVLPDSCPQSTANLSKYSSWSMSAVIVSRAGWDSVSQDNGGDPAGTALYAFVWGVHARNPELSWSMYRSLCEVITFIISESLTVGGDLLCSSRLNRLLSKLQELLFTLDRELSGQRTSPRIQP